MTNKIKMYADELDINKIKILYWDREFNVTEIADKLGVSSWSLYNFMHKNKIALRSPSEANYVVNKIKPQFKIRNNLSILEKKLKIAGIMLY